MIRTGHLFDESACVTDHAEAFLKRGAHRKRPSTLWNGRFVFASDGDSLPGAGAIVRVSALGEHECGRRDREEKCERGGKRGVAFTAPLEDANERRFGLL